MDRGRVQSDSALISLRELARHIPGKPSYNTVRRWATDGVKDSFGEIRVLRVKRGTQGRLSCIMWFNEFLESLDPAQMSDDGFPLL